MPSEERKMKVDSVEQGLRKLCESWNNVCNVLMSGAGGELARFTFLNKKFNCGIKGGDCFVLTIRPDGADLKRGKDDLANATIHMEEWDWLSVLGGEYSLWSVMIAGRLASDLHESQPIITLGALVHALAKMGE